VRRGTKIKIVCSFAVLLFLAGCGLRPGEMRLTDPPAVREEVASDESAGEVSEPGDHTGETAPVESPEAASAQEEKPEEAPVPGERGEEEKPVRVSASRYAYTTLNGETQRVYDEVYQTLLAHTKSVKVSTLDAAVLDEAYRAVMADYGEIFWNSGYVYTKYTRGDELVALDFAPGYTMTMEARSDIQREIDAAVAGILSGISADSSDYEKVRYVFDYLASNVEYVVGAKENQNIISVFLYGETVCQGYASATQYLLAQLGVQSAVVTGEVDGVSHAWNLVRMDNEYYYVDTTWGNSTYTGDGVPAMRFVNYNYFGVTTEELLRTHAPDDTFVLPNCAASGNNYYVREGKFFSDWNPDAVGALCRESYERRETAVSVKFASGELYRRARQYLIEEGHITDYCSGITSLYYVEDEVQNVLTFSFG